MSMQPTAETFVPVRDTRLADLPWKSFTWPLERGIRLCGDVVDLSPAEPGEDAVNLFRALDHDLVWAHVAGRPRNTAEYTQLLAKNLDKGRVPWIVRLRRSYLGLPEGAVIGTSSYLDVSPEDARLEIGSTAYTPKVWGTAVNPEVKLLLLSHAFDVLGAGRVQLKTDVRNVRSQQAIARLGARYEGTLRRYQRRADGTVRDTVMFSVTVEDWPAVRDQLRERLDCHEQSS